MNTAEVLEALASSDELVLRGALSKIGADRIASPAKTVARRIIDLFGHPSPEVRNDAIFAIGLHWAEPLSFEPLLRLVVSETDDYPLGCALRAIGGFARQNADLTPAAVQALATVALDAQYSRASRGVAYLELRRTLNQIDVREYARAGCTPETQSLDLEWVAKLRRGPAPDSG